MNKVFRTALTGVISVGLFSTLSVAPAQAYTEDINPTSQISLTGTPDVGGLLTLTKQIYSWPEQNFGVTWLRCNSAKALINFKDAQTVSVNSGCITIATQPKTLTYTVAASDAGKHITAVVNIVDVTSGLPSNSGYSMAQSLPIAEPAPASGGATTGDGTTTGGGTTTAATPTLTAQTAPATVPATIKAKKKLKIRAKTSAGLPVKVTVAGGCKVKPVVKTTKKKVGKKTVKTKTVTAYTVTMGKKKRSTCTITQANAGDATFAPLNSVSTVTLR